LMSSSSIVSGCWTTKSTSLNFLTASIENAIVGETD
jgi:hypothetical protein